MFQWAPTLGGECYWSVENWHWLRDYIRFNGHPPLGVNATEGKIIREIDELPQFQWAPTLGGECYLM